MGIIISKNTKCIVQGITGNEGTFWTERMLAAGTNIVAGITPGKKGEKVCGVPVYNTVREAMEEHQAEASVMFVPPPFAKDACFEALDAGIKTVVCLADGVPVQDALEMRTYAKEVGAIVTGPNNPGMATVGEAMLGFVPVWLPHVYQPGHIGMMARSGSLTNEIASYIVKAGHGVSTFVGCGGDPAPCTRFTDLLPLFEADPQTKAIVIIGELGGSMEEEAAEYIAKHVTKPVFSFISGRSAPPGKKMGHAGAIISAGKGTVQSKETALKAAGVHIATRPAEIYELIKQVLG